MSNTAAALGHRFGQYVRVSKDIFNKAPDVQGIEVKADLIARVVSPVKDDRQSFAVVAFPADEEFVCVDLIGYIGATKVENLIPIEEDDIASVADFVFSVLGSYDNQA